MPKQIALKLVKNIDGRYFSWNWRLGALIKYLDEKNTQLSPTKKELQYIREYWKEKPTLCKNLFVFTPDTLPSAVMGIADNEELWRVSTGPLFDNDLLIEQTIPQHRPYTKFTNSVRLLERVA